MTLAVPPSPEGKRNFREEPFHLASLRSEEAPSLLKAISALTAGYLANTDLDPSGAVEILASRIEEIRHISSFNYAQSLGFLARFGLGHEATRAILERAFFEPAHKPTRLDYVLSGLVDNIDNANDPFAQQLLLRFFSEGSDDELAMGLGEIYEYEESSIFSIMAQNPLVHSRLEALADGTDAKLATRAQMVLSRMGKLAEDQIDVLSIIDAGVESEREEAAKLGKIELSPEEFRTFFCTAMHAVSNPLSVLKAALSHSGSLVLLGLDLIDSDEPAVPSASLHPLGRDLAQLSRAGLLTHLALPCSEETLCAWQKFMQGGERPKRGFLIPGEYPPEGDFDPFFEAEIEESLRFLKSIPSSVRLVAYLPAGSSDTQGELWLASKVAVMGTIFERTSAARVVTLGPPGQLSKEPLAIDDVNLPTFSSALVERLPHIAINHVLERPYVHPWPFEYLSEAGMDLDHVREKIEPTLVGLKDFAVPTSLPLLTKLPWELHADPESLFPEAWDGLIMRKVRGDDGDFDDVAEVLPEPEYSRPKSALGV